MEVANTMSSLFGDDTFEVSRLCLKILEGALHPFKGCYSVPFPNFRRIGKSYAWSEWMLADWYRRHTREKQLEGETMELWNLEYNKLFSQLEEIAHAHSLRLKWLGESTPDQWIVFSSTGEKRIGTLLCSGNEVCFLPDE